MTNSTSEYPRSSFPLKRTKPQHQSTPGTGQYGIVTADHIAATVRPKNVSGLETVCFLNSQHGQRLNLVSIPTGAKSILCFVWKMRVLVRISMTDGGSTGVATAKRANCGGAAFPSAPVFPCMCRYFRRPLKFRAWDGKDVVN